MEDVTKKILNDLYHDQTPQVDSPDQPKKAIRLARAWHEQTETILKISDNRWYVQGDANLIDLANDLERYPGIPAVGVVEGDQILGIIVRKDLFSILGRPFGKDVLMKEAAFKMCQPTKSFHMNSNIFAVSEDLGKIPRGGEVRYFTIHTDSNDFAGIFSSQDLLHYLSENTQKDLQLSRSILTRIVKDYVYEDKETYEIMSSSTMAREVGGDFCYIDIHNQNHVTGVVCDVSGKGVAAALGASALWGAIAGFDIRLGLGRLVEHLNQFFIKTFDQEKFVTGVFFDFDPSTRAITLADLGHGFSYIYRKGRLLKMKTADRTYPLGISKDLKPELYRYTLQAQDVLLILTDGLLEQPNDDSDEYGLSRIKKVLENSEGEPLSRIRLNLMEDFHAFRGKTPLADDLTFVLLRPKSST